MNWRVKLAVILLSNGFAGSAQPAMPRFWLEPISGVAQADVGQEPMAAQRLSPLGDTVVVLIYRRVAVRRTTLATGQVAEIVLDRLPEMRAPQFNVLADIDVDAVGSIYVPVVWRETGKVREAGVGVWNSQGRYARTITLDPPVEIRHLAVAEDGNLFVLGIDPDYYQGRRQEHMLVHKYSPDGKRLASFSRTALPGPAVPAGNHRALTTEVERGMLWMQDGLLWQMLPVTKALRGFTPAGNLAREVPFQQPAEAGDRTATIWRVMTAGGNRFLVDWLFETGAARSRGIAVHEPNGRPVSALVGPREGIDMPLACDSAGNCVVIRPAGRKQVMTRARLRVQ